LPRRFAPRNDGERGETKHRSSRGLRPLTMTMRGLRLLYDKRGGLPRLLTQARNGERQGVDFSTP